MAEKKAEAMFQDRREAGRLLGRALARFKAERPIVLGLPRGGVEVAYEVALALEAPLDIIVSRKLGAPNQPELAIGAIVDGDHPMAVFNEEVMQGYGISQDYINRVATRELKEIERRQRVYRQGREALPLRDATAIVVDDGIATGASVRAALRGLRRKGVGRLILAVPVAPEDTLEEMRREADEVVCLETPADFRAVGHHYDDFGQTSDETVIELLAAAARARPAAAD